MNLTDKELNQVGGGFPVRPFIYLSPAAAAVYETYKLGDRVGYNNNKKNT